MVNKISGPRIVELVERAKKPGTVDPIRAVAPPQEIDPEKPIQPGELTLSPELVEAQVLGTQQDDTAQRVRQAQRAYALDDSDE
jgi:hypothetical protein